MDVIWRELDEADLPAVVGLAERVLAADGGLPLVTTEPLLRGRLFAGSGRAGLMDGTLVAAAGLRSTGSAFGLVDPAVRGRGLGSALVEWSLAGGAVQFETETLTEPAHALLTSYGLRQTFAEDVMARDLQVPAPDWTVPGDLLTWTTELAPRFYAVYSAAFRDRPGFPGWSQAQWVEWIADDEDFAPQWTFLAVVDGEDAGFVACAHGGWLVQLGVVPAARGAGVGAGLTAEVLRRMAAAGEPTCFLDVNVNNPGAARVYQRCGFRRIGRRARYRADRE
jgi:mycothiol synthase